MALLTTTSLLTLLALLTTLLLTTTHAATDPFGQPLPGSCGPHTNYPLESEFTRGYTDFCTSHLQLDGTIIREDGPIVYTYKLLAGNGAMIDWVFRAAISDQGNQGYVNGMTNTSECLRRFGGMLQYPIEEKWYCVVDGTGGDAFAVRGNRGVGEETVGEGKVLVWAGKEKVGMEGAKAMESFEWEARLRKGS